MSGMCLELSSLPLRERSERGMVNRVFNFEFDALAAVSVFHCTVYKTL